MTGLNLPLRELLGAVPLPAQRVTVSSHACCSVQAIHGIPELRLHLQLLLGTGPLHFCYGWRSAARHAATSGSAVCIIVACAAYLMFYRVQPSCRHVTTCGCRDLACCCHHPKRWHECNTYQVGPAPAWSRLTASRPTCSNGQQARLPTSCRLLGYTRACLLTSCV